MHVRVIVLLLSALLVGCSADEMSGTGRPLDPSPPPIVGHVSDAGDFTMSGLITVYPGSSTPLSWSFGGAPRAADEGMGLAAGIHLTMEEAQILMSGGSVATPAFSLAYPLGGGEIGRPIEAMTASFFEDGTTRIELALGPFAYFDGTGSPQPSATAWAEGLFPRTCNVSDSSGRVFDDPAFSSEQCQRALSDMNAEVLAP